MPIPPGHGYTASVEGLLEEKENFMDKIKSYIEI